MVGGYCVKVGGGIALIGVGYRDRSNTRARRRADLRAPELVDPSNRPI